MLAFSRITYYFSSSNPVSMKNNTTKKFFDFVYSSAAANFLGFVVAMASTKLVSHFFTTRSIKNLWGLTARKTVIDKQTFNALEWMISIVIGFIVFEIISKGAKKKIEELLPKCKSVFANWMGRSAGENPVESKNS
jgi:hypothetical protein